MSMMASLRRAARAGNRLPPEPANRARRRSVRFLGRAKLVALSAAVTLAGLSAVMATAGPAYAACPTGSVSAYGGPGELWVTGCGFDSSATVRVDVLTNPGFGAVGNSQQVHADSSGGFTAWFSPTNGTLPRYFSGSVYVAADQLSPRPSFGTAWASTVVESSPGFVNTGQPAGCGTPVITSIEGFLRDYQVRVELLKPDLSELSTDTESPNYYSGDVDASLKTVDPTTGKPYQGAAWIVADEIGGYPPAPAEVWQSLNVC